MCLEIITRNLWHATPPAKPEMMRETSLPVHKVFFNYTNTYECQDRKTCINVVKYLQDKAMRILMLPDIFFSFMIGGDGKVYEGRGFYHSPCLPGRSRLQADISTYIAYIGSFKEKRPSAQMRKARFELVKYGVEQGIIKENHEKIDLVRGVVPNQTPPTTPYVNTRSYRPRDFD